MVHDLAVQVTEALEEGVEGLGDKVQAWPAPFDQSEGASAKKQQQQQQRSQQARQRLGGKGAVAEQDGLQEDTVESEAAADEAEHIMQRTTSSSQLRQLERGHQQQAGAKRKGAYGDEKSRARQRTAAQAAALSTKLLQHQQKLEVSCLLGRADFPGSAEGSKTKA
jgi:hypothetical protein